MSVGHPACQQAPIEIIVGGEQLPPSRFWHMDAYEKHAGRWSVVWSQATVMK